MGLSGRNSWPLGGFLRRAKPRKIERQHTGNRGRSSPVLCFLSTMQKSLFCLVSLLLVPCLIADPVTMSAWSSGMLAPSPLAPSSVVLLDAEALSVRSGWVGPLFWRKISAEIEGLVGLKKKPVPADGFIARFRMIGGLV